MSHAREGCRVGAAGVCGAAARAAAALVLLVALPAVAPAQSFGRNKVLYERFPFAVLNTEHFRVYHYPERSGAGVEAAGMLEGWYGRYLRELGWRLEGKQPVVLYNDLPDFRQTNVVSGLISEGVGGVTEGLANRIVVPLTGIRQENDHVLGHELVHAFQFTRIQSAALRGVSATAEPPLWFVEGMAEYLSRGRRDALTAMWLRDAVLHDDVPDLSRLTRDPTYFPYRFGQAFWAFVAGTWGEAAVPRLFDAVVEGGTARGLQAALGVKEAEFSRRWVQALKAAYGPDLLERDRPEQAARRISPARSRLNLSPVISPDGRYVAYFSRRDPFTLDLFLADAGTGRVIRRLARSERDEHFDALRFTDSAGAWSPDSRTFAFVVYRGGDNAVVLEDVRGGRASRTLQPKGVDSITDLAWSPDGRTLALAGTHEAVGDLYLLDLKGGGVERLTDGSSSELQPAWSPDGRTLAFVTDRGADAAIVAAGASPPTRIALLDLATRRVELLPPPAGARAINPQFAPDGDSLYLVADPDGVPDVYRFVPSTGELFRVTRLATGVTGLTELSPCLSVARKTGTVVFSAFARRDTGIYRLDAAAAPGLPVHPADLSEDDRAVLPSVSGSRTVPASEPAPQPPPVPAAIISTTPYRPGLSIIGVGQAGVGVAFDPFGTRLRAPIDVLLSDVLGDHLLDISADISSDVATLGGQVVYLNQANRLNWGVGAGHIPLEDFSVVSVTDPSAPSDVAVQRQVTWVDQAELQLQYPLSPNRRVEAGAGYQRYTFRPTADLFFIQGFQTVGHGTVTLDVPSPLNLGYVDLAYVGDTSFFGFTSPLSGSRYRLEVRPVFGSLLYLTALADFRQYVYLGRVSLAFRGLYLGRYLRDAENSLLSPISIGNPLLVRGYYPGSFRADECGGDITAGSCPVFDRLFGSQATVFNAEVRLPLFGNEELGLIPFRQLPVDLVAFLDGGLAWTSTSHPVLRLAADSEARVPVFSAGVAVRVNLMGAAVLELNWAWPFQRPRGGWQFGLLISPGW